MANWILIQNLDNKQANLVNLDLVPHVERQQDGSVIIHISPAHRVTVQGGKLGDAMWEKIRGMTVKDAPMLTVLKEEKP